MDRAHGNAELMRMQQSGTDKNLQWIEPIIRNTQLLQMRLEHLMAAVRTGPPVLAPVEIVPLVLTAALASIPVALPDTFTLAAATRSRALDKLVFLPTTLSSSDEAACIDLLCAGV